MPRILDLDQRTAVLRNFFAGHARLPSYSEMQSLFGYRSKNAVHYLVGRLEKEGFLRRGPAGRLVPAEKLTGRVRVLGAITEGLPDPPQLQEAERRDLDKWLVGENRAALLLTVVDNTLWEQGVLPGDRVLIDANARPRAGDLVLEEKGGEWRLCVHEPRGRARATAGIRGVVQAVLRKLR